MLELFIWDDDAERATRIHTMLTKALREQNVYHALVLVHSEAPMLKRHGFWGKTPAIQYESELWFCHHPETMDQEGMKKVVSAVLALAAEEVGSREETPD